MELGDIDGRQVRGGRVNGPKRYEMRKPLGKGSFGVVCLAKCRATGSTVAVKKVLQDPKYKNRELDIMKQLDHWNVVTLLDSYYTEESAENGGAALYLNVVMDYVPETVYRVMKNYVKNNSSIPMFLVKLYTYQVCRAVGYMHACGICHRDIKPQNLLVDTKSHVVKLCDFGSAKRLLQGEVSVAYICSRFYRAPELMLGSQDYTTAIDTWSIGCVLGELIKGEPLFAGQTSVEQLVKIIQVLGTPSRAQMLTMNPHYMDFKFPEVTKKKWHEHLGDVAPASCYTFLSELLKYDPAARLTPLDALSHSFFDDLRQRNATCPDGQNLPELFNFTELELSKMSVQARAVVVPPWYIAESSSAHANAV